MSSILSLECIDLIFLQHDESDVFTFCFSVFWVFLSSSIAAQIFASACHFASAVILHAVRNAASAHHPFFAVLFCCCCLCFLHRSFANTVARLHQLQCLSLPPPFPFKSSFLLVLFLLFSRFMHAGKSPSTCLSFCLPPPSLVHLSLPWFPCVVVCI